MIYFELTFNINIVYIIIDLSLWKRRKKKTKFNFSESRIFKINCHVNCKQQFGILHEKFSLSRVIGKRGLTGKWEKSWNETISFPGNVNLVMKLAVPLLARTTNIPPIFQDVENILLSIIVIFLLSSANNFFSYY